MNITQRQRICIKDDVNKNNALKNILLKEPRKSNLVIDFIKDPALLLFKVNQKVQVSMLALLRIIKMFVCTQYVHNEISHA